MNNVSPNIKYLGKNKGPKNEHLFKSQENLKGLVEQLLKIVIILFRNLIYVSLAKNQTQKF